MWELCSLAVARLKVSAFALIEGVDTLARSLAWEGWLFACVSQLPDSRHLQRFSCNIMMPKSQELPVGALRGFQCYFDY